MTDATLLLAQSVMTSCLCAWMVSGVLNNLLKPKLNYAAVCAVMRIEGMEVDYPDDYAQIAHRRIDNPLLHKLAFGGIILSETISALLLLVASVLLWTAFAGAADPGLARTVAVVGALAFIVNWTGFLIGGEYFCYWYTFFNAQATHVLLLIWGALTVIVLFMGGIAG